MIIGYIRVSTDKQESGVSLENQEAKIKQYCQLKDLVLDSIVTDISTGRNLNRKGLQGILSNLTNVDHFIVLRGDRLSRKTKEMLDLMEQFKTNNVTYHSINDSVDTSTAIGKFFFTILAAKAELESDMISERVTDSCEYRKKNGLRNNGKLPYGYMVGADKKLIPNPEEMRTVKLIMGFHKQGYNYSEISRNLKDLGLFDRKGSVFHHQTISNIVKYQSS